MTTSNREFSLQYIDERLRSIEDKVNNLLATNTPPQYMSVKQLAEYLNRSCSWVYHSVSDGTIPCIRDSSGLRFRREEIDAWMQERYQAPVVKPVTRF